MPVFKKMSRKDKRFYSAPEKKFLAKGNGITDG
jgi:hypothetical protein